MSELIWHDLESGAYAVDLDFWLDLQLGEVLELGAGAGRVSLPLAIGGARVTAIDLDGALLEELRYRASVLGVEVDAIVADARTFDLGSEFEHVVAPAAFIQLLTDREDRVATMRQARRHLRPDGRLWLAIHPDLDEALFDPARPPGPEWAGPYESRIEAARRDGDQLVVRRRRRDRLENRSSCVEVVYTEAAELEAEAREAGLEPVDRSPLPDDDRYSRSEVLSFRASYPDLGRG